MGNGLIFPYRRLVFDRWSDAEAIVSTVTDVRV